MDEVKPKYKIGEAVVYTSKNPAWSKCEDCDGAGKFPALSLTGNPCDAVCPFCCRGQRCDYLNNKHIGIIQSIEMTERSGDSVCIWYRLRGDIHKQYAENQLQRINEVNFPGS